MLRHIDQWRFGVFWQGDGSSGDGSSGDGTGDGASATGAGAAADAAAAAAGYGGVGSPAGAPAGTSATGTGSFGGGMGGGDGTAGGVSDGVAASVSFGGGQAAQGASPGVGPAGGVGTGVAGIGGGSAAGGFGGAATGAAVGGSGVRGTNPLSQNLIGLASQMGVPPGVLTGVPTATTPVGVSSLAAPGAGLGVSQSAISALNRGLTALTGGQGFGQTTAGAAPAAPQSSLSQLALASLFGNTAAMNMGFPALEGVSPGLTAMPGPSPAPSQVAINPASVMGQPTAPISPSELASAQNVANLGDELGSVAPTGMAAAPAQSPAQVNAATNTANVAPTPEAVQAQLASNQAGGSLGQLLQAILGMGISPTQLAQLAQAAMGGQVG